jgi:hypothetical protein
VTVTSLVYLGVLTAAARLLKGIFLKAKLDFRRVCIVDGKLECQL